MDTFSSSKLRREISSKIYHTSQSLPEWMIIGWSHVVLEGIVVVVVAASAIPLYCSLSIIVLVSQS